MDPQPISNPPPLSKGQSQFPCKQCGAMLEFEPGTRSLKCRYCGTLNEISLTGPAIEELDFQANLLQLEQSQPTQDSVVVHCDGCGAESTLPEGKSAGDCPFCGRAVVATGLTRHLLKPRSLLPFAIKTTDARTRFDQWLASLWFAPGDLKRFADAGGLKGVYMPAWTFDCQATTDYTGQRGDHYYVSESYTAIENGKSVTRTRQVKRTRWSSAWGRVFNTFDDVLVYASRSLPADLQARLTGWDLPQLVPYQDDFLSGFIAETYQIDLREGFELGKQIMDATIRSSVRSDIGGDEQRIDSLQTAYADITFKHILLPVWISAYRYRGRTFHFLVNARTGAVYGHRPWSAWKIAVMVIAILIIAMIVLAIVAAMNS